MTAIEEKLAAEKKSAEQTDETKPDKALKRIPSKSVLQTQAALCFNRGVACCGLEPTKPFKAWVIQSEDDDDRVVVAGLEAPLRPSPSPRHQPSVFGFTRVTEIRPAGEEHGES